MQPKPTSVTNMAGSQRNQLIPSGGLSAVDSYLLTEQFPDDILSAGRLSPTCRRVKTDAVPPHMTFNRRSVRNRRTPAILIEGSPWLAFPYLRPQLTH
jgi:hypothetical protein